MKKLLYCAAALAMTLFAGSCQRENLEPVVDGGVTYTITLDDGVQTKGSNGYAEYDLYYQVFKTVDPTELETALILTENHVEMSGNTTNISLELLNDQDYTILFWANKKGENYYDVTDLRNVQVKESLSNNDSRDAFCAKDELINFDANLSKEVKLKRPFAQINIATLIPVVDYDVTPLSSMVRVSDVPLAYNVATAASVGSEQTVTFGNSDVPPFKLKVGQTEYKMVAMNYVVVPDGNIDELYYEITTANGVVKNSVNNIPVKPNYRTNIIGNLLTSNATYTVEILPGFADQDGTGNMEVLTNGIVKNLNGDYEITNSNGLVYAIENLFNDLTDNGVFYVLNSIDMTGVGFNPADVPSGKVVNIIGEMPLVTRSTTSTTGIVITGLNQPLIDNVATGANASFTNIYIEDYQGNGAALVANNEGTVVISGCEAPDTVTLVGGTNDAVDAGNVTDETLTTALESGVSEITLAEDINTSNVILINRSVTINGNNKIITSSANRVFRLTNSNTVVTIKDLNVVSTAVMTYPNDVRGISIDNEIESVNLTLDNCTIDFTDETTNDWTYAVNLCGKSSKHSLVINGGEYEGANVVNIWGDNHNISIDGAILNCIYPQNTKYAGACITFNRDDSQAAEGSYAVLKNSTFNGNNARVVYDMPKANEVAIEKCIDNTKRNAFVVNDKLYSSLGEAINVIEIEGEIDVIFDYEKVEPVTIPSGKSIVLDLNGNNISGVDTSEKSFGLITNNGTLTIKSTDGVGSIKLSATVNRAWSAYSSIISNTVGGVLAVESDVEIEHLGGTDMAYGIDNLTNGKGTSAKTTINGATIKSTYSAIRQFLNGIEAANELKVNSGTIEGGKRGIWMQDPSTKANTGTLIVKESASVNNVHFSVTDGSTSWPVEVSVAAAAVGDKGVTYGTLPVGYAVIEEGGIWKVVTGIATVDAFKAFAADVNGGNNYAGKKVYLLADLDLNNEVWTPIGTSAKPFKGVFDGQNHTISNLVVNGGSNSDQGLFGITNDGEIKNLTINNAKVSGRLNVGVLVGTPYTSKYTNIKVTGHVEVDGMAYVGGVGGKNAYANWTDVTVDVDKTSYVNANSVENGKAYRTYVGGVCGFNGEGSHTFTNIKSNIDVKGSTCDVGGLFGIAHYGNNFVNCSCSADVEIYNATEAAEAEEMGGIAGVWHNENGTKVTFTNCSFTGSLKSNFTAGVDLNDNTIVGAPYSATGTGELIIK